MPEPRRAEDVRRLQRGTGPRRPRRGVHVAGLAFLASLLLLAAAVAYAQQTEQPLHPDARVDRIAVHKATHWLEAYWRGERVGRYRVATGMGGAGPKRYEGDRTTPEGRYRIDRRHRSRQFHRFLHVSYPNAADRRRFRALRAVGEVPAGSGIGSAIGIHGQPRGLSIPSEMNWTAGCIAVSNEAAEALYRAVIPGAVIVID